MESIVSVLTLRCEQFQPGVSFEILGIDGSYHPNPDATEDESLRLEFDVSTRRRGGGVGNLYPDINPGLDEGLKTSRLSLVRGAAKSRGGHHLPWP